MTILITFVGISKNYDYLRKLVSNAFERAPYALEVNCMQGPTEVIGAHGEPQQYLIVATTSAEHIPDLQQRLAAVPIKAFIGAFSAVSRPGKYP